MKICCCNVPCSRPLSGEETREVPFELEYASDSEYMAPSVVVTLVPIDVEIVRDPSLVSWFRDDEEEGSVVVETRELSPSMADLQENVVPILIWVTLPPPVYQESVRSGQHCVHSNGVLEKSSFHPYCCGDTFMGMPISLHSTQDLHHNPKRLQRAGSSHKHDSAHLGSLSSETSYGNVTDRLVDLGPGTVVGGVVRHSTNPEV